MKKTILMLMTMLLIMVFTGCNSDEPEPQPTGKYNLTIKFPTAEEYPDITLPEIADYSILITNLDSGWGWNADLESDFNGFANPLEAIVGNYLIEVASFPDPNAVIPTDATQFYGSKKFYVTEGVTTDVVVELKPRTTEQL